MNLSVRLPASRVMAGPSSAPRESVGDLLSMTYKVLDPWNDLGTAPAVLLDDQREPNVLRVFFNYDPELGKFVARALGGPHHQPQNHALGLVWEEEGGRLGGCVFPVAVLKEFQNSGSETSMCVWQVSAKTDLS